MGEPARKKDLNVSIDADVHERFQALVTEVGTLQYKAVAAALTIYMASPSELREAAARGDVEAVREWFASRPHPSEALHVTGAGAREVREAVASALAGLRGESTKGRERRGGRSAS